MQISTVVSVDRFTRICHNFNWVLANLIKVGLNELIRPVVVWWCEYFYIISNAHSIKQGFHPLEHGIHMEYLFDWDVDGCLGKCIFMTLWSYCS